MVNYLRKEICTCLSLALVLRWDRRKSMLMLILLSAAWTATSREKVAITPANPGVAVGRTLGFKANVPVTWSLTGAGSLSQETSTSVAYTAPSSITVTHSMAGCPVMPNDSIFNTRIDNLPVHPTSETWVSGVVNGQSTSAYKVGFGELSWGISTSNARTPTKNLVNYYGGSTPNFPMSSGPNLKQEDGNYHSLSDGQDHHIMNVRTDTCQFFEVYNLHTPAFWFANGCNGGQGSGCNAQSSVAYNWSDYTPYTGFGGTDAAGLPLAPLTMHLSEFYGGSINHPLRFTSCVACIYRGATLWPAAGANGSTNANAPPMGTRFRLRICGGSITTKCATLSNYSPYQRIVLTALHNYGMILADIGTVLAVSPGTDISLDRTVLTAVDTLGVPIVDFEVVDESSLQYAAGSYATCPFNATCAGPKNTYETPANQAILTAKPAGGGQAISIPIAIQGVTIGLNAPVLYMEAGSYSYQIPSWVNGTSNQNVTWSLVSGPGSVTSRGVYTPPVSPTGSPAVLKVTSAADSNATAYGYIYLLPQGTNPKNSIRIDSGNYGSSQFIDRNGNHWQTEVGLEDASPGCCGVDAYPGWKDWLSNPEIGVYQTIGYGAGSTNDMQYSFIVPNGNYKVRAMYGAGAGTPFGASVPTTAKGQAFRLHLETQGNIELHNFNFFLNEPAGYVWKTRTPSDAYVPAKVTNNVLQFANRSVFYDVDLLNGLNCPNCSTWNSINGLEIIPDSTPAHWAIDTQQQSTATAGSSIWQPLTNGGGAWEFGTAFIPKQSGYIAGVRFYKAATDTGAHTGSLWINDGGQLGSQKGTLLATGKFTGETENGWQILTFRKRVPVTAGTQYVISYHSETGTRYQAGDLFTKPLVQPFINGPLEALMGMYTTGSGGVFPGNTSTAMFAVDPIFSLARDGSSPATLLSTNELPGQQLQFYVQDWYTGVNDPQWSIVSGPGTIAKGTDINNEPCGIYTAPNKIEDGAAVTIKAQSATNPSISAETTFHFTKTAPGSK